MTSLRFSNRLPRLSRSSRDVRRFKEVRKEFERGSECLEGAQARNAQAPRGKQHEVEEASNALLNARRAFRSEALDYVLQVRRRSRSRSRRRERRPPPHRLQPPLPRVSDQRHRGQEEDRHPGGGEFAVARTVGNTLPGSLTSRPVPSDAVPDGIPVQLLPARTPVPVGAGRVSTEAERGGKIPVRKRVCEAGRARKRESRTCR